MSSDGTIFDFYDLPFAIWFKIKKITELSPPYLVKFDVGLYYCQLFECQLFESPLLKITNPGTEHIIGSTRSVVPDQTLECKPLTLLPSKWHSTCKDEHDDEFRSTIKSLVVD